MVLIIILTFIGVFAVIVVPIVAMSGGGSKASRQAVATLQSVISAEPVITNKQIMDFRKREDVSSIPWLNQTLLKFQLAPSLRTFLSQAQVDWSPGRLLGTCCVCFSIPAVLFYLRLGMLLPSLAVGILPGLMPMMWVMMKRNRRFHKFEEKLPEALELMVSALRAGHSLLAAMGLVAQECPEPVGGEFKICFEEQNYGLELKTALDNLGMRIPLQDLRMVNTAIIIQKESGGNLAEVLDNTAFLIRERFRIKREIKTHTAQGRLTGWILTALPVCLGIAMFIMNPKFMSILWHRDIGIKMMWTAAGMIALGGFTISRIVDIDV